MAAATELEVGRSIGVAVPRKEDAKLLAGQGEFMDNLSVPGMVWMVIVDAEAALAPDAPLVHDDFETNRCYTWAMAAGDVETAFAEASVVVTEHYRHQRLIPNAIEPRGVLVKPLPATGQFTLWTSTQ